MKSSNVCILIPTVNRAEMLLESLNYSIYHYNGIDIRIYDSSPTNDTEAAVSEFVRQTDINAVYKRTSQRQSLDCKLADIFKFDKELLSYKYVWLISDSVSIFPDAMLRIKEYLKDDFDLIRLPSAGYGVAEDKTFYDADEWFHNASRNMAHMASTIMNTKLLKGKINWDELYDKYIVNDDIYDDRHGFFFTVGFYLERILSLNKFRGILIGNDMKWWRESPLKYGKSYWQDLIFSTWARSYCETIFALPDIYTDKESVIKESDNLHCGRFGEQSLISLRIRGLFSLKEVKKYRPYWRLVSKLPLDRITEIAATSIESLKKKYGEHYGDFSFWKVNLENIEKGLSEAPIIVYGAGLYGGNVVRKLTADGYEVSCVAVSDAEKNPSYVEGVPVKSVTDILNVKDYAVVVISVMSDTAREIKMRLNKLGFKNIKSLF